MAGTAPTYDNIRWGGPQGGRIPQEVFPATFTVVKEVDLGSQAAATITLSANQAMASSITITPTGNIILVYPAVNPGQLVAIENLAPATYTVTVEVAGNTDDTVVIAAATNVIVVHDGTVGGIALVGGTDGGSSLGDTAITGTLSVSGATTLSAAATVGTTLGVTGATTLTGALTASSTSHLVGAITADGALTVTGITKTGPVKRTLTAITADGAINAHTSANYIFTKTGVAVMTLGAPTATTDDGLILTFTGTTDDQNTITATNLFATGAAANDVATWPAHAGGTLCIMAYQALWYIIYNNLVVMS